MDQGGERPAVEGTACVSFSQSILAKTLNKANLGDIHGKKKWIWGCYVKKS